MQYAVDGLFIILAVVIVGFAAKKGFVKAFLDGISTLLAGLVAYLLSTPVANLVYNVLIRGSFEKTLTKTLQDNTLSVKDVTGKIDVLLEQIPESAISIASKFGFDLGGVISNVQATTPNDTSSLVSAMMTNVADKVLPEITKVVCTVILFVIISLVLTYVIRFFDGIVSKIPVVKQLNNLLGGVIGILKAAVILVVLATVIFFIVATSDNEQLVTAIDSSAIYMFITEHNPLLNLFK